MAEKTKDLLQFPNKAERYAGDSPLAQEGHGGHSFNAGSLTLIGIGGIIGAGFFLASGMPISQAGPAIVLSYVLGALIMAQVLGAITTVSMNHPLRGSFRVYAEEYLGHYVGYLQGWLFFVSGILAVSSEAVAMAHFTRLWLPDANLPLLATVYVVLVLALNAFGVKSFGHIESVMSIVKILALIAFIGVAAAVVAGGIRYGYGLGDRSFTQWRNPLPNGWMGVGQSMLIVIFSYAGIGVIANAVGTVDKPKSTIPKAATWLILGLAALYVLSLVGLLFLVPWDEVGTAESPFVTALNRVHLEFLGSALNAIILIAAFSVMAGAMYSNMVMVQSLAEARKAPAFILRRSRRGQPWGVLAFSTAALLAAMLLAYLLPSKVYNYMTSASAFFTFFNWSVMTLTFLMWYRRSYRKGDTLSGWTFFRPYGQWLTLLLIGVLAVFSLLDADQRVGFYYAAGFFLLISLSYPVVRRRTAR